jgi:hypothetical protein
VCSFPIVIDGIVVGLRLAAGTIGEALQTLPQSSGVLSDIVADAG